jgi:hypothetical protein
MEEAAERTEKGVALSVGLLAGDAIPPKAEAEP